MSPSKPFIPLLAFLLASTSTVFGQENTLGNIVRKFQEYSNTTLQEKLFVHVDRSFYLTGETLWFKIYCVDASFHKPLEVSKVGYVEILDKDNKAVLQAKILMDQSTGSGSIFLPASLGSGQYLLRAYTHWMENFSPDLFFQRPITIVNPFKKLDLKPIVDSLQYDIQFFPEGGGMVSGMKCKVAFRAIDKSGRGISFKGALLTEKNDTAITFKPLRFGMGHFEFTPNDDQQYTAIIVDSNGKRISYRMPVVHERGYSLALEDTGQGQIKLRVCSNLQAEDPQLIYLLVHTRQVVVHSERQSLKDGCSAFTIDKKILVDGISHFTVFNSTSLPVAERLYFKRPEKKLLVDARSDQQEYGPRNKVVLDLFAHNAAGHPEEANMSVAVFLIDSLQHNDENDIVSYLWLTSELKGTVESPEYYFNAEGAGVEEATDNLMLTHGWTRFRWEDIFYKDDASIQFVPEYRYQLIHGTVFNRESGAPAPGIITYFSIPGKNAKLYISRSDAQGKIQFEAKDFYGTKEVIVKTNTQYDSIYGIKISSSFTESVSSRRLLEFDLSKDRVEEIIARSLSMQVQSNYHEKNNNRFTLPAIDSAAFYGNPDAHYFLDDYTRFKSMEEVMREYVDKVWVRKNNGKFRLMAYDQINQGVFKDNPMVFVDGVPLFDMDKLMALDPLKIKKLDVMTRKYFLGTAAFEGILNFTTYRGDASGLPLDKNALTLNYAGLQPQREFYVPGYETQITRESHLPDFRNLLYWSPKIKTSAEGKYQFEFFTSDLTGKFKMVLEGITRDGNAGQTSVTFEVKGANGN